MKKIYYLLVNLGKISFTLLLLLITSISLHSFTIKGKVSYGDRCYQNMNGTIFEEYDYEGVKLIKGKLKCNTYYLEYESSLDEDNNILFLSSLAKLEKDNDVDVDLQVVIKGEEYQLVSAIVNYQVSYTKSYI